MFGELRREVGEAISKICKLEGVTIIKAAVLPDHVHMYVSILPKESVAKVVGRIYEKKVFMERNLFFASFIQSFCSDFFP